MLQKLQSLIEVFPQGSLMSWKFMGLNGSKNQRFLTNKNKRYENK